MNVYEKLNLARIQFNSKGIKKNGKNSFAGYSYFELTDILPVCNQICSEIKAACVVSFTSEIAKLDFIDCEKPEDIISFTCPMSEANQKGCQPVQNLGSVQTYIKRYLYQNCFEIAENDCLDAVMNPNETVQKGLQVKKTGNKEMDKDIAFILDVINHGKLSSANVKKAQQVIQNPTKEELDKLVDWIVNNVA